MVAHKISFGPHNEFHAVASKSNTGTLFWVVPEKYSVAFELHMENKYINKQLHVSEVARSVSTQNVIYELSSSM